VKRSSFYSFRSIFITFLCACLALLLTACGGAAATNGVGASNPPNLISSTPLPTSQKSSLPQLVTTCPQAGQARAAALIASSQNTHSNTVVYVYNQGAQAQIGWLKRYDIATGRKSTLLQLPDTIIDTAQVSADGQWVLFTSHKENSTPGSTKMQLIRIDGQGLQTLYCGGNGSQIDHVQWSQQSSLLFSEASTSTQASTTYLLTMDKGTVQAELVISASPTDAPQGIQYYPLTWLDATHAYVIYSVNLPAASPQPYGLYILDTAKGAKQTLAQLQHVLDTKGEQWSIDPSRDGSQLFKSEFYFDHCTDSCKSGPAGPSSITVEAATGGTPQTIYNDPLYAVSNLRVVSDKMLLVVLHSARGDGARNGLWKMNSDGSNMTELTPLNKLNGSTITWLNTFTQSPWADISRDGSLYTVMRTQAEQELDFGSLNGGNTTQIAAVNANGNQGTIFVAGWGQV